MWLPIIRNTQWFYSQISKLIFACVTTSNKLTLNESMSVPGIPSHPSPLPIWGPSESRSSLGSVWGGASKGVHPNTTRAAVRAAPSCAAGTPVSPARRPSAEELLQQLEAVRTQVEGGPYGQIVSVNMEKLKMVRTLREKDTEIGHLQQQMKELEVGSVWGHTGTCWYYSGHPETLTWRHLESIQDYNFSYVHQK